MEREELVNETKTLADQIKTSFLHLNNLRLLCELCEEKDEKVQFQAMKETYQVFEYIMREKGEYYTAFTYKTISKEDKQAEKQAKVDDQISEFLHLKYTDFVDILLYNHLGNKASPFQTPALKMILRFVLLEHQIYVKENKKNKGLL